MNVIFHDFPLPTPKFHDFPGLENEIIKFHDFPGFPWPVWTLGAGERIGGWRGTAGGDKKGWQVGFTI